MKLILYLIILSLVCVNGLKILGVFSFFGKSSSLLGHALMRHLADAGHEVSYNHIYLLSTISKIICKIFVVRFKKKLSVYNVEIILRPTVSVTIVDSIPTQKQLF